MLCSMHSAISNVYCIHLANINLFLEDIIIRYKLKTNVKRVNVKIESD